jgi:hypothetical protein
MQAFPDDEMPIDPEAEWALWVANLSETTRRILTDPASDRETVYRDLVLARRISFGAILLELFALETRWGYAGAS